MDDLTLPSINVNLLVILDALLTEQNVTRAAKRVGISQSAMSHNLATLRELFDDALLTRTPTGMEPTQRALELGAPLRRALLSLQAAIQPPAGFEPSTSTRQFCIAAPDFITATVATRLLDAMGATAPGVDLVVRPMDWKRNVELLENPEVDMIIGPKIASDVARQVNLFQESFVCVVRKNHPSIGEGVSLKEYAAAKHLMVSPTGIGSSLVDGELERNGLTRRIVLRVPSFLAAPIIVSQSDLMLTALRSSVEALAKPLGLRLMPAPFRVDALQVMATWNLAKEEDPGHCWLRGIVRDSLAPLPNG